MPRPIRSLVAACRAIRQAVTIWTWIKTAFAKLAAFVSRLLTSITKPLKAVFPSVALPAVKKPPKSRPSSKNASGPLRWRRWRRMASTFGFRRSKPADRTFRTPPKSSSVSSSISVARAAFRRCSSSNTTTLRRGVRRGAACSKPSAGSSRRTSTKGASSGPLRCGARTSWSRSYRTASPLPSGWCRGR